MNPGKPWEVGSSCNCWHTVAASHTMFWVEAGCQWPPLWACICPSLVEEAKIENSQRVQGWSKSRAPEPHTCDLRGHRQVAPESKTILSLITMLPKLDTSFWDEGGSQKARDSLLGYFCRHSTQAHPSSTHTALGFATIAAALQFSEFWA